MVNLQTVLTNINMDNVKIALEVMGKGMLGIFAALIIIALSVWVMQKIFKNKEDK